VKGFVEWVQEGNFTVRQHWDREAQRLIKRAGKLWLFPHQERIFNHCLNPTMDEYEIAHFPYETIIFSCPKKSGKTALAAAIGTWYAQEGHEGAEIYSLANDLEQAEGRAMREMKYHAEKSGLITSKYRINYPGGTFIQVLSSHYTSAAGAHQSLTLWDELWGYNSEKSMRLWEEMTPIPTEESPLQVVVTYAGFEGESDLLWELYKSTVLEGRRLKEEFPDLPIYESLDKSIFCYWDHEPRMPWQTEEYYEKQITKLRPAQFLRLHRNEWATSEDVFIPIEWWDKAAKKLEGPLIYSPDEEHYRYPIYVGVDVGVKHDTSALVGVWYDYQTKKMGLAFAEIWKPSGDEILDLEVTVEAAIRRYCSELNVVQIWADPTHFYRSITALRKEGIPIEEFKQSVTNLTAASAALYDALQYESLEAYRDPVLRDHIRFALAKPQGAAFRIIKSEETRRPIDGAIALAIAVYNGIAHGGVDLSEHQIIKSPEGELTAYGDADVPKELENLAEVFGGPKNWEEWPADLRPDDGV